METRRPGKRNERNRIKTSYCTDRRSSALHATRGEERLDLGQKLRSLARRLVSPVVSEVSDDLAEDGRLVLAGFECGVFPLGKRLHQLLAVLGIDGAELDITRLHEISFPLGHFVCSKLSQPPDLLHGFSLFSLIGEQDGLALPDPPSQLVGWYISIGKPTTQGGELLENRS